MKLYRILALVTAASAPAGCVLLNQAGFQALRLAVELGQDIAAGQATEVHASEFPAAVTTANSFANVYGQLEAAGGASLPKKVKVSVVASELGTRATYYRFAATLKIAKDGTFALLKPFKRDIRAGSRISVTVQPVGQALRAGSQARLCIELVSQKSAATSGEPCGDGLPDATFRVLHGNNNELVEYTTDDNLVMCTRDAGWADLWVRLARDSVDLGENSPHLDIDVCNLGDGGKFSPKDPTSTTCGSDKSWDIWWHDGAGTAYANEPTAPTCELDLAVSGNALSGTFACGALDERNGADEVAIVDGQFRCTID